MFYSAEQPLSSASEQPDRLDLNRRGHRGVEELGAAVEGQPLQASRGDCK